MAPSKFISSVRRRRWPRRPRWPWLVGVLLVVGAGCAVAIYLIFFQKEGNFSNPNAEFDQPVPAPKKANPKPKPETFKWKIYGYTPDRNRFLDAPLPPPYKKLWKFHKGHGLIEFQPVLANGVLYYVNNGGAARAVNAKNGKKRWRRRVGSLNASSPAWNGGRLFIATLSGTIKWLDAKNGKIVGRKRLPSRAESSPIVVGGVVYFGS